MGSKWERQICITHTLLQLHMDSTMERTNLHVARLHGDQPVGLLNSLRVMVNSGVDRGKGEWDTKLILTVYRFTDSLTFTCNSNINTLNFALFWQVRKSKVIKYLSHLKHNSQLQWLCLLPPLGIQFMPLSSCLCFLLLNIALKSFVKVLLKVQEGCIVPSGKKKTHMIFLQAGVQYYWLWLQC